MRKKKYEADSHSNYLTGKDAVSIFNVGESTIKKLAAECGAKVKIGSLTRYRRDVLEDYIESMQKRA